MCFESHFQGYVGSRIDHYEVHEFVLNDRLQTGTHDEGNGHVIIQGLRGGCLRIMRHERTYLIH
jgi:hypothetical protein